MMAARQIPKEIYMKAQQHKRIARIKKVSGYLHLCLTWIRYMLWAIWPLIALLFLMGKQVNFTIGALQINDVELTLFLRLLMITIASVFLFLALKLVHHFRSLIKHFAEGDVFNKAAINHARKALFNGLLFYGLYTVGGLIAWIYGATQTGQPSVQLNVNFVLPLMFFGLMYVLLWALEIGCDLNEESELTI
jgi:hypothetical protein